jgi:hypothetical protein
MVQLELFGQREDLHYALNLTMFDLRVMHHKNPVLANYLYEMRHKERERINHQVARATFVAKLEGNEYSKLSRHRLIPE